MEVVAVPIITAGFLYWITKNKTNTKNKTEKFQSELPNTNLRDKNYPNDTIVVPEYDRTSKLSVTNHYDTPHTYTDKYFTNKPQQTTENTTNTTYQSLTGETVTTDYFRHENMVPFFGSSIRGSTTGADSANTEGLMDTYTGAGSQTISNSEQTPLFRPQSNINHTYGAPNMNDFYQSRVVESSNRSDLKPFDETRVGPGLGERNGLNGQGGFNSGMMERDQWQGKTVDELRVATNPKASEYGLLGYESKGKYYIPQTTPDSMGKMEKNRPNTTVEIGEGRYFTTTGRAGEMAAMPGEVVGRTTTRPETSVAYSGVAMGVDSGGMYVSSEYAPTRNVDLGALPTGVAGATGAGTLNDGDYGKTSVTAYPNNRTVSNKMTETNSNSLMTGVGSTVNAMIVPILDALQPTRKEDLAYNIRQYENPKGRVPSTYIYDPQTNKPSVTNKQILTERSQQRGGNFFINRNPTVADGYLTAPQDITDTKRMKTTDKSSYSGVASAQGVSVARSYKPEYDAYISDTKSSTLMSYTPSGVNGSFNAQINPSAIKQENRNIPRDSLPTRGVVIPASLDTYGEIGGHDSLASQNQMNRSDPNILTNFKQNPYTHSIRPERTVG